MSDNHVTIRCMTVPGTGHLHNVSVTIDGERSLVPEGVTLSYGSPSILAYSDVGAYRAFTRGSQVSQCTPAGGPRSAVPPLSGCLVVSIPSVQTIRISGKNFGPGMEPVIEYVQYVCD